MQFALPIVLRRVGTVHLLERLRDALVHARPARGTEALIQRLVDERVDEAEAPDLIG